MEPSHNSTEIGLLQTVCIARSKQGTISFLPIK
jgi:hypothetical protein